MTARTAIRYVALMFVLAILGQAWYTAGPFADSEIEQWWQFWMPPWLPIVGLLSLPLTLGYFVPLGRRLGGMRSMLGRTIISMAVAATVYAALSTLLAVGYGICPVAPEAVRCDFETDGMPYPNLSTWAFMLTYVMTVIGAWSLLQFLSAGDRFTLANGAFVAVLVIAATWMMLPNAGTGYAFGADAPMTEQVLETLRAVGAAITIGLNMIALSRARSMVGGAFFRPLVAMVVGFVAISTGDLLGMHLMNAPDTPFTGSVAMQGLLTVGFIVWYYSVIAIGRSIEGPVGSSNDAAPAPAVAYDEPIAQASTADVAPPWRGELQKPGPP